MMISIGNSTERKSGVTGSRVSGLKTGVGGTGLSAWMLYQKRGKSVSFRMNFVGSDLVVLRVIRDKRIAVLAAGVQLHAAWQVAFQSGWMKQARRHHASPMEQRARELRLQSASGVDPLAHRARAGIDLPR